MSVERLSGQGYAPIPQCVSNTDTEEEDEHLSAPIHNSLEDSDKIRVCINYNSIISIYNSII